MNADHERSRGDDAARAFEAAVAALSRKERTRAEMAEHLAAQGFGDAEVEEVLERLIAIGELDDERFAALYAADKRDLRGWGPERIKAALLDRGVPLELAERAVEGHSHSAQTERAAELLADRGQPLTDDRARARALAFLARRGYSHEVAYAAIRLAEREAA